MKTVQTFYNGVKNSKGELIFSGHQITNPLPASAPPTGVPGGGYDTVRIWGFQNENYDWKTFNLDRDMPIIDAKVGFVDATDPDLTKFKAHGGKLLLYAGWGDTGITPENTVAYYESVGDKMGKNQGDFTSLHGAGHGHRGAPPNTFDTIGARVVARETTARRDHRVQFADGPVASSVRIRSMRNTRAGNMKDAANWSCVAPDDEPGKRRPAYTCPCSVGRGTVLRTRRLI
jgi:hypothetical protein